jgi:hypothetical protein
VPKITKLSSNSIIHLKETFMLGILRTMKFACNLSMLLIMFVFTSCSGEFFTLNMRGSGTVEDPYLISQPSHFNEIRNNLSAHYKLTKNIDMSSWGNWEPIGYVYVRYGDPTPTYNASRSAGITTIPLDVRLRAKVGDSIYVLGFDGDDGIHKVLTATSTEITFASTRPDNASINFGLYYKGFSGSLNGNGYSIKNLSVTHNDIDAVGIFSSISGGAKITNLILDNINVRDNGIHPNGGASILSPYITPNGLSGDITLTNVTIKNSSIELLNGGRAGSFWVDFSTTVPATNLKVINTRVENLETNPTAGMYVALGLCAVNMSFVSGMYCQGEVIDRQVESALGPDSTISALGGFAYTGSWGSASLTAEKIHIDIAITSYLGAAMTENGSSGISIGGFAGFSVGNDFIYKNILVEGSINLPGAYTLPSSAIGSFVGFTWHDSVLVNGSRGTAFQDSVAMVAVTRTDTHTTFGDYRVYGWAGYNTSYASNDRKPSCTQNCFYNSDISGSTTTNEVAGFEFTSMTDAQFNTASNFAGLDTTIWKLVDSSYPCLKDISPSCN